MPNTLTSWPSDTDLIATALTLSGIPPSWAADLAHRVRTALFHNHRLLIGPSPMTTHPLVATPIYTIISKGPRKGQKIINWPATADAYEESLKTSTSRLAKLSQDHEVRLNQVRQLQTEAAKDAEELTLLTTCLLAVSRHWTFILLPRQLRNQILAATTPTHNDFFQYTQA